MTDPFNFKRQAPFYFKGDDVSAFLVKAADRPGKYLQGLGRPSPYTPLEWLAVWLVMQDRWVQFDSVHEVFGMSVSTIRKFTSGNANPRLYEALVERFPTFEKEFTNPRQYKAKRRFTRPTGNANTRQRQMVERDEVVWGATSWQVPCPTKDVCLAKAQAEVERREREADNTLEIQDLN